MADIKPKSVAAVVPSSPRKMSYEAFLAWADEDTRAEWVDGEVIELSPASKRHQLLANFLAALLQHFVEARGLGVVIAAPFQMKLGPEGPGREPDVLFLSQAHLGRLEDTYLNGPADLAVEIISPESRARDRGDKFYEYEQGGVREYWLIDPIRKQAEFYSLGEDGIYTAVPTGDGLFRSTVLPGLALEPGWLWQEPLPRLLSVLKVWGLV
ncbi:MAG: Uma2 family endonuclease [Deinococcota bacterium]|jgi:Uma2 family endonuclease|nr:Uma2 family endonuclease [Deinococcota bacterium]